MSPNNPLYDVVLHLGDNALILGHRLSEWCGHGPVLEQDIAMTNVALDLIGQARLYYDYAVELEGVGKTQDDLAFKRDVLDFKNLLLVELPNGNFAQTLARQFFFDTWHLLALQQLSRSTDTRLAEIAQKAIKEVTYHQRWSAEWVVRLGDGTPESHEKMQQAVDDLWTYTGEMFSQSGTEKELADAGKVWNGPGLKDQWMAAVSSTLSEATLNLPGEEWMQGGGKEGLHTEYLGYLLAEMQFLPRAYPDAVW